MENDCFTLQNIKKIKANRINEKISYRVCYQAIEN